MSYYSSTNRGYGFGGLSLKNLEKEFNQLFGNLPSLFDLSGYEGSASKRSVSNADWFENDDAYEGRLDLPGVNSKDVEVSVEDRQLLVKAVRKTEGEEESSSVEYSYSQLLPEGVNEDAISAKMSDGVLSLRIPKSEKAKPRKIEIN